MPPATPFDTIRTHTCVDCGRTDDIIGLDKREAARAQRARGWELRGDGRWACPDHRSKRTGRRLSTANDKRPARVEAGAKTPLGRLSHTFLEQREAADAEYRRRIDAREARERDLAEAVFAQGRREWTPAQAAAMDPNRTRLGLVGPVRSNDKRVPVRTRRTQEMEQAS